MIIQGNTPQADIDNVLNHSWSLSLQENVFGNVGFASSNDSVASVCGPFLASQGKTQADINIGLTINSSQITLLLLNQSLEYFQKAFCSLSANYILAKKGFKTWSSVTNYYSSYFCIHALLCLQGQTITRIQINSDDIPCHVIALDLTNHVYCVTKRGLGKSPEHKKAWNRYYTIYDRYIPSKQQFKIVHTKSFVTDPSEESDFRNTINYSPFQGFAEVSDLVLMESFIEMYENNVAASSIGNTFDEYLDTLESLSTDPDFQYFARSIMRLFFIADTLKRIANRNNAFKLEWDNRIDVWQNFTKTCVASSPANNNIEAFSRVLKKLCKQQE